MQDDVEDKLDTMLRSHLKRELDPYVGSAMRKFDAGAGPRRTQSSSVSSPWLSRVRYTAAAMLMLGVGVIGSIVYRNANTHTPSLPVALDSHAAPFTDAVQTSWTQTYDQGTVMIDPQTPARMLRRVQYEKTDWKDQTGKWQSRIDIPSEDVILVDMPKQ